MNAYDYTRQQWVSGQEGDKLSLEQTREELELLRGPKSAEYLRFIGVSAKDSYIATMEAQERRLLRQLGQS